MVVRWRKSALKELQAAYDYIKERSPQAADKVRTEIIEHTEELTTRQTMMVLTDTSKCISIELLTG